MNTSAIIRDNVEEEAGHERVVDKEDEGHSRIPFAFALLVTVGLLVMNLFLPDDFDALNYFVFFRAFAIEEAIDLSQKIDNHSALAERTARSTGGAEVPDDALAAPPLLYAS